MAHCILQRMTTLAPAGCLTVGGTAIQLMEIATMAGSDGRRSVPARGVIGIGDTERLRVALASADSGAEGLRTVVFDGTGGAVDEALAMAALMDWERVAVVGRSGATCASACAQIVFLASANRMLQDNGRLGFHSCSGAGDGNRASICNERIARQAGPRRPLKYRHGVHAVHGAGADKMARRCGCRLLEPEDLARRKRQHETRRCAAMPFSRSHRRAQRLV